MATFHRRRAAAGRWAIVALLMLAALVTLHVMPPMVSQSAAAAAAAAAAAGRPVFKSLRALPLRGELGQLLELDGAKVGAELGVQRGKFAAHTLRNWPSCTKYYLVDLWAHQPNYHDLANVDDAGQQQIMQTARDNLKEWEGKTVFIRNFTSHAAPLIPDASLDYVYVDARHDYCGVMEDLELYWPKLKPGGVFAGHDYVFAKDKHVLELGQDWSVCMNGTVHEGAVRGAVDEFAARHGLLVMSTLHDGGFESWITRKPVVQR